MSFDEAYDAMQDDLLDVLQKYQELLNPQQAVATITQFAAKVAFSCAPTGDQASELMNESIVSIEKEFSNTESHSILDLLNCPFRLSDFYAIGPEEWKGATLQVSGQPFPDSGVVVASFRRQSGPRGSWIASEIKESGV